MSHDQQGNERFQRGLAKMLEFGGEEAGSTHSKLIDNYRELADDLPNLIVEFPFGDIYSRGVLDNKRQAMIVIAALTAIAAEPECELWINSGFNVGLTKDEIVGTIIHLIPYVGFPRCLNALGLVKKVMHERGDIK